MPLLHEEADAEGAGEKGDEKTAERPTRTPMLET
jgi:hypothetical protein